ncbi:MAG TPA: penicillin-binding transpeptidase domain-containing protein, partial [Acidimicrobiales bacterium]|nr:penicillin-binding transpeptidase domain-containing protein [Acidimicrobiales bacterium]
MRGRITGLAVILLALFGLVIGQAVFLQVRRAAALDANALNPRVYYAGLDYPRGEILASNLTVLARSIATKNPEYPYRRSYPLGSLFSDVVGWASTQYGTWGLEEQYNQDLINHAQPIRTATQVLSPTRSADNLVTTLSVPLQQVAARALAGRAGAVVALDPRNGAVLALYSNPTYDPAPMTSLSKRQQEIEWKRITQGFVDGFHPLTTLALQDTFPPGSTFKVVTTAAILRYEPSLATLSWGPASSLNLAPWGSDKILMNAGGGTCGGTIQKMLPESCDPGYAYLGIQLGAQKLHTEATQFGFDSTPPLDLPQGEVTDGYFPSVADYAEAVPQLGYSAIGQWNVRSTALQDALVAA